MNYLIDESYNGFEDLAFERSENDALVFNGEGDESSPIMDQSIAYALYSSDRHYKPMPPTVTKPNTNQSTILEFVITTKDWSRRKKPASALDVFHELRDEVFTKVATKETWV